MRANMTTNLLDLPVDILLLLLPHLSAPSLLALTSTCHALHDPIFLSSPTYWSHLVRTTFRVPNTPVVESDGARWRNLYKRMKTQSRIYTWGNNEKSCLGHSHEVQGRNGGVGPPAWRRVNALRRRHVSSPGEMLGTENLGVVADLQCGGWSTTLLTAKGALYSVGVLDGLEFNQRRRPFNQNPTIEPTLLRYPPAFVDPSKRYEPHTAAREFSAGRTHVLALSDSGRIWSWQNIAHAGLHVKFLNHDVREDVREGSEGSVSKVVAGWNMSAAYIEGAGIVLWEPLKRENGDAETEDTALVLESGVVPMTSYRRERRKGSVRAGDEDSLAETIGEVQSFIVLEAVVLFNTHLGKMFVALINSDDGAPRVDEPYELKINAVSDVAQADEELATEPAFATDVQGSYTSFAVFLSSGAVLTLQQSILIDLLQLPNRPATSEQSIPWTRIPALQHKNVIRLAFGDYHFHALHSSGHITSYGVEPQSCGALGLGGHGDPEGRLRGIRYAGLGGDGRLVPHAYTEGRRVWFEPEKREWVTFLTAGGVDPGEAQERMRLALGVQGVVGQGEVSEWIEQEGRAWGEKFGVQDVGEEGGTGAYFALSVTAAGWHSGALVLVNDDLAGRVREACEVRESDEPIEDDEDEEEQGVDTAQDSAPTSYLATAVTTVLDYGRWFLGIGPYAHPSSTSGARPIALPDNGARQNTTLIRPRNFGESPREGYKYAWAGDHFPRLRLSDGREMPGTVDFDEWRFGRPEFQLDAAPPT